MSAVDLGPGAVHLQPGTPMTISNCSFTFYDKLDSTLIFNPGL